MALESWHKTALPAWLWPTLFLKRGTCSFSFFWKRSILCLLLFNDVKISTTYTIASLLGLAMCFTPDGTRVRWACAPKWSREVFCSTHPKYIEVTRVLQQLIGKTVDPMLTAASLAHKQSILGKLQYPKHPRTLPWTELRPSKLMWVNDQKIFRHLHAHSGFLFSYSSNWFEQVWTRSPKRPERRSRLPWLMHCHLGHPNPKDEANLW